VVRNRGDRDELERTKDTFQDRHRRRPDDGEFRAYCPALKGLHTCGETRKDALKNARSAAEAYIASLIKHNDPIPVEVIVDRLRSISSALTSNCISFVSGI
jgi:predicted RNase H-like HicB family nuclease